jgi:hypothetical protein
MPLLACGPSFPNSYLIWGNEYQLTMMPRPTFSAEVADAVRREYGIDGTLACRHGSRWVHTLKADKADLEAALAARGVGESERKRIIESYGELRVAIKQHADGWQGDSEYRRIRSATGFPLSLHDQLLCELPSEFAIYVRGAAAYKVGDDVTAHEHWIKLLELPKDERHYRSTWAAFMLGKMAIKHRPKEAVRRFVQLRDLAAAGFADSANLTASSFAWEVECVGFASVAARLRKHAEAFARGTDRDRFTALVNMRILAGNVLASDTIDRNLISDVFCRRVLVSYVVSHHVHFERRRFDSFLRALDVAGVDVIEDAERLAWAGYNAGQFEHAERWLEYADFSLPWTRWLQAKLELRSGSTERAASLLQTIATDLENGTIAPGDPVWQQMQGPSAYQYHFAAATPGRQLYGELGVLYTNHEQYDRALVAFLRGGLWLDAAHVAERLMSTDAVEKMIAELAGQKPIQVYVRYQRMDAVKSLRHLLARRLVREKQWQRAATFMPIELGGRLAELRDALRLADDTAAPVEERAAQLFRAGMITREVGMELMGTELAPDFFYCSGQFENRDAPRYGEEAGRRAADSQHNVPQALLDLSVASPGEAGRHSATRPIPDKRFHYRYQAAELMWRCAELLPDNTALMARALYIGGRFIADRDPKTADKFYKALVNRNRRLAISREADRLRWFPENFYLGIEVDEFMQQIAPLNMLPERQADPVSHYLHLYGITGSKVSVADTAEVVVAIIRRCAAALKKHEIVEGPQWASVYAIAIENALFDLRDRKVPHAIRLLVELLEDEGLWLDPTLDMALTDAIGAAGPTAIPFLEVLEGQAFGRGQHLIERIRGGEFDDIERHRADRRAFRRSAAHYSDRMSALSEADDAFFFIDDSGDLRIHRMGTRAALRVITMSEISYSSLATSPGTLWIGCSKGLIRYTIADESWALQQIDGEDLSAAVSKVAVEDGELRIRCGATRYIVPLDESAGQEPGAGAADAPPVAAVLAPAGPGEGPSPETWLFLLFGLALGMVVTRLSASSARTEDATLKTS